MRTHLLRSGIIVIAILLVAPLAFAAGNGSHTGTTTASSYATVSLTIPSVVGIDVESDVDFGTLPVGSGTAGAACTNFFPPAPACTGAITFNPGTITTTAGITGGAAASLTAPLDSNAIWVAIFSNNTTAVTVTSSLDNVWTVGSAATGSDADTAIVLTKSTNNNTFGFPGSAQRIASGAAATTLGATTAGAGSQFGWTRVDQVVALQFGGTGATNPNASAVTFNAPGARSTHLNFTVSH